MEITFVVHSRLLGYNRGDVITMDLADASPTLKAVLRIGRHITLIDPLELPDGSGESSNNSKEHRPPYFAVDGQSNTKSSRKRESGAASNTGQRNGGDRGSS